MLARRMLELYLEAPRRKALYAKKIPGIKARLQAAEHIAKSIGLIRNDVFGVRSGFFVLEYRRNLAIMKLISHALYELEMDGWIKVFPGKIYYIDKKSVPQTPLTENHKIFNVIASTVKDVATTFEGDFANIDASEIKKRCWMYFRKVNDLKRAEKYERERVKTFWERHDISPLTTGAAKDITASGYFYNETKKVFDKSAESFVIPTGNSEMDKLKKLEALEFDQYIGTHMQMAKEKPGEYLRQQFSLGKADRSTFFPGNKEFDFLKAVDQVFDLDKEELEVISRFVPGEITQKDAVFLHKFLALIDLGFREALAKTRVDSMPEWVQDGLLREAKASLPELFNKFSKFSKSSGTFGHDDFLSFLKNEDPKFVSEQEDEFKQNIGRIAKEFFAGLINGITKKLEDSQPYDITYVISDIHLQDYVHRDIYELLRLIDVVVATGGNLVINGDFLDTWRASNLALILRENKLIFDALRKVKKITIVKGNHDGWLELFNGEKVLSDNISVVDRLYNDGIHIEHGNDMDRFNSTASWIGEVATKAVNKIERNKLLGQQLLTWIEYFSRLLLPKEMWKNQKQERLVKGVAKIVGYRDPSGQTFSPTDPLDVTIGHFHSAGLFESYQKVLKGLDERFHGKVRFFLTDSWYNSEGYAGQVTIFAKKKAGTGQRMAKTIVWNYIDAKKILTLYGSWEFKKAS